MASLPTKKFNLRDIRSLITQEKYMEAFVNIQTIDFNTLRYQEKKGFNTLFCRILIKFYRIEELKQLFEKNDMMSRDWIAYLIFLNKIDSKLSEKIFIQKVINKIDLKPSNIDRLIDEKCYNLLSFLEGYFLKTSRDGLDYALPFTNFDENLVLNQNLVFSLLINKSVIKIKKDSYNVIIDGGNVLYSSISEFENLKNIFNSLVEKNFRPIIVLHERHKKKANKFLKNLLSFIVFTPRNQNDDYYIIYLSLMNQSSIITRDQYGDHIANYGLKFPNNNFLKNYFDEKILKFNTAPITFSTRKRSRIIKHNNGIYIPTESGKLFCLNFE